MIMQADEHTAKKSRKYNKYHVSIQNKTFSAYSSIVMKYISWADKRFLLVHFISMFQTIVPFRDGFIKIRHIQRQFLPSTSKSPHPTTRRSLATSWVFSYATASIRRYCSLKPNAN